MNDPIFKPIKINNMEIKNRIYMPAMHLGMATDGKVSDRLVDFYAERAKGGVGMITAGFATVNDLAGGMGSLLAAQRDEFTPSLSRLAEAIKSNGARCAIQINHAGANAFSVLMDGQQPVSASNMPGMSKETPRPLTLDEVRQTIDDFAQSALRVKRAGFDAVEIISAGGYLISQFLSPVTNKREDEYGGPFENRIRFGLEVMQAVRQAVGKDYPVIIRINGNEFMPGGLGRKDLQAYAAKLSQSGSIDAINVNVGWHQARVPQITTNVPRGMYAYLARGIKSQVNIPVIASHRINDPKTARELLGDGLCDMVAMGRGLIADPFFPEKAKSGREKEIVHCIGCAQGCFDALMTMRPIECLCNPLAGYEKERRIEKAAASKTIMVIGGGAAGISAALAAKERGHEVKLYEQGGRLGGQLFLAGAPPGREEFAQLADDLALQLTAKQVPVILNQKVDATLIENEKPDAVLLATGANPITPSIPGVDRANVVQAWDVLRNTADIGRKVVIIGGGAVGVETALFLAEKGTLSGDAIRFLLLNKAESPEDLYQLATAGTKEVVVIEMLERLGQDIGKTTRWGMMADLSRFGVETHVGTKALEITESGVRVERAGREEILSADTVVLAIGATSENSLEATLSQTGVPYKIVGDANKIAQAYDAIHDGFNAGREI